MNKLESEIENQYLLEYMSTFGIEALEIKVKAFDIYSQIRIYTDNLEFWLERYNKIVSEPINRKLKCKNRIRKRIISNHITYLLGRMEYMPFESYVIDNIIGQYPTLEHSYPPLKEVILRFKNQK